MGGDGVKDVLWLVLKLQCAPPLVVWPHRPSPETEQSETLEQDTLVKN